MRVVLVDAVDDDAFEAVPAAAVGAAAPALTAKPPAATAPGGGADSKSEVPVGVAVPELDPGAVPELGPVDPDAVPDPAAPPLALPEPPRSELTEPPQPRAARVPIRQRHETRDLVER